MSYGFPADLEDKVCVITGGGGVIGTALAIGLGNAKVKTVILDIQKDIAENTAGKVTDFTGSISMGVEANVLDKNSLHEAYKIISGEFGQIDYLINGAGGNSPKATTKEEFLTPETAGSLEDTFFGLELEGFQKVFDLNFIGTLLPTMVFSREMVKSNRGVIINISSMNAFRSLTKIPAYSAAKASINNFTEWLAVHFAKVNVRINAIAPGFFLTHQNEFLLLEKETKELTARGKKIISNTPMGRFGKPEELVGTVYYLLSDMSKFVTGVVIPIDGGFNVYSGV